VGSSNKPELIDVEFSRHQFLIGPHQQVVGAKRTSLSEVITWTGCAVWESETA
jgi:hypothetical protein